MPAKRGVLRGAFALVCAAGAALALADVDTPLRMIFTPLFLLAVPGIAAMGLLRDRDPLTALSVGVATSLLANVLLATAMLTFDAWSPRAGVVTIAVLGGFIYVLGLVYRGNGSMQTGQGGG
ncbi:peptidoglycan/LPS O-acetylase OafA/YrhL [Streptosporangium album]|uniref:Peptidoglycan/LPS O-acetylase OafA/YrhL n=1 Tax=Streptosporangium album TaxID=47479 RepID=A0A7W7RR69_9ACTN|nr:peptidoglycan/LPS O-acetylase OafA/YrhL [Streptosporangium album]